MNTLKKFILAAYKDYLFLGRNHTLAACEFYDQWRIFPEDGAELVLQRVESIEHCLRNDLSELEKNEILWEIENNKVIEKTYCFTEVQPSYLELFCHGFPYLSKIEFNFYFCAWMLCYAEERISKDSLINELFFTEIEDAFSPTRENKLSQATIEKKKLIALFLSFVASKKLDFSDLANKCLNLGWKQYL